MNGQVEQSTAAEIQKKVTLAHAAKSIWKSVSLEERIKYLSPLLHIVVQKKDELALLISKEMGSPLSQCKGAIDWDLEYIKSFFNLAKEALQDEIVFSSGNKTHRIVFEPKGVVAVIVPWNFPFDMFIWGVIPNLLVGNTVVFKHAEECALFGKKIEEIMAELHLPEGTFSAVHGDGEVGAELVRQNIDSIWFTGSTQVGKILFETAGKKFIHSTLEMGGSNPAIIFEDISIKEIVPKLYSKRFYNSGQVCDAIKRIIVHESRFDELVAEFKEVLEHKKVGNPLDGSTDIGPLVSQKQLYLLQEQLTDAKERGATIVTGGKQPKGLEGAYFEPTILTNVTRDMKVWNEEVFGPAIPIIPFKTESEAIAIANDTQYGLGAVIFSKDTARANRVARLIDAGTVEINLANHWVAETPFGGYKLSGMGREHGIIGLRELCQMKVIAQ